MASVGDVTVQLRARVDQLERDLQQGQRAVEGFTGRAGSAFSRLGASVITLNQAVQLASQVGRVLGSALTGTVRAAGEAQAAVAQLDQTLRSTGQYSRVYSDELRGLASRLQLVTAFGDEAILSVQRQLVAFGATRQQIAPLTRAVLDLSTGMGRDLGGAALLVGKALAGEFSTLSRFGIQVEESASKSEKLAQALAQITQRFGGQAQAAAATYEGRLRLITELFGDLQEEIGAAIVGSEAFQRALGRVADGLVGAIDATNDWVDANRELVDQRIDKVFDGIAAAAGKLPDALSAGANSIRGLGETWDRLPQALLDLLTVGGAAVVGARLGGTPGAFVAGAAALQSTDTGNALDRAIAPVVNAGRQVTQAVEDFSQYSASDRARIFASRRNDFVVQGGSIVRRTESDESVARSTREAKEDTEDLIDLTQALSRIEASRAGFAEAAITRAESEVAIRERALSVARDTTSSQEELLRLAEQLDAAERSATQARIADLERKRLSVDLTEGETAALTAQIEALNAELASGPKHVEELTRGLKEATGAAGEIKSAFAAAFRGVISGTELGTGNLTDSISRLAGGLGQRLIEPAVTKAVDSAVGGIARLFSGGATGATAGGASFVGPPTEAQAAAAGSNAPPAGAGAATGAAAGGFGAAGFIGLAMIAVQGAIDASRAGRAARLKVGATEDQALDAARKAFPLGSLLIPAARFTNGRGIAGNLGPLADPLGIMTGLRMLGVFRPPSGERQLSSVLGSLFKQRGIPGVPSLNALNLRAEGRGGLERREGFEAGGPLDLAALTVGTQLARALPELPEQGLVPGRTRNAILNTLSGIGLSVEDARDKIRELGRSLQGSLGDAVVRFNQLRGAGKLTRDQFDDLTTGAIENFNDLPPAIDASRLALLALSDDGVLSLKRLERAIDDATAAVGGGIAASFNALVETGSAGDAAEALGDQFGETFQARVAERLLQSQTIGTALTEAATLAEQLAEARAAGDTEAATTLQAQLRDVYTKAQGDYLAAVTPIALATRQDLRIFSGGRAANGLIDEGSLTLPRFASGGIVGGPIGAAQLAVVHGGEHVTTPAQQGQIVSLLGELVTAMRRGMGVTVNVAPAPVQIDGRDIVAASGRARVLQRTGVTTPEIRSHRG